MADDDGKKPPLAFLTYDDDASIGKVCRNISFLFMCEASGMGAL